VSMYYIYLILFDELVEFASAGSVECISQR